jgi:hypothetical protein
MGEKVLQQAFESLRVMYSPQDLASLASMQSLAKAYYCQSRFKESEELLVQEIEMRTIVAGSDDEFTMSMGRLARIYIRQERPEESGRLSR